jgi:hypothetical protein
MIELLDKFGWENLNHPPYSPNLEPSDFNFFPKMKEFLGSKRMTTDEVEEMVTDWLYELPGNFYA